ncbi:MAG: hypothetical protein AAF755_01895 [Pseudomonadota bacterium]
MLKRIYFILFFSLPTFAMAQERYILIDPATGQQIGTLSAEEYRARIEANTTVRAQGRDRTQGYASPVGIPPFRYIFNPYREPNGYQTKRSYDPNDSVATSSNGRTVRPRVVQSGGSSTTAAPAQRQQRSGVVVNDIFQPNRSSASN